jgi:hypothetical protein
MQAVEEQIAIIRTCAPDTAREVELEAAKAALIALARGPDGGRVREHIDGALRGELLEVRWELEDVLEATAPAPPEPAPTQDEPDAGTDDSASDEDGADDELVMVYDDPRGLVLHRTRDGTRWFATQVDPATGQPATFELPAHQIPAVQQQLAGSPYWVLGGGG